MKKLTVLSFVAFIGVFSVLLLVFPKNVYSDDENRYLTTFPKLTFAGVKSGEWMEELEAFVDDQFPGRLSWIALKTNVEQAIGKPESNGIYIAEDGRYIESFKRYDEAQYETNITALNQFADVLDMPLQVMLVPTAATILKDRLPKYALDIDQNAEIAALRDEQFKLIEVGESLLEQADEYIYYRTDHHWTSLGAYIGYKTWKPDAKPLEAYKEEILSTEFLGTLYSKIKVTPTETDTMMAYYMDAQQQVEYNLDGQLHDTFYAREFITKKDKYSVYFNGNQPVTKIIGAGNEGKLLIIKDSYANTFAQFAVADYAEVHMIDLRGFNMPITQYIEMVGIDEVLVLYNFKNFTEDPYVYALR